MTFTKVTSDLINTYSSGSGSAVANQIVALNGSAVLPAVDGSQLLNVSGTGGASLTWNTVTANTTASINNGYVCNSTSQITITLPSSPSVGNAVEATSIATGGWFILPASGQTIYYNGLSIVYPTGLTGGQNTSAHLVYMGSNTWYVDYASTSVDTVCDPFWNNVSILIPGNTGTVPTVESSGNGLSLTNSGVVSTTGPTKFGISSSLYFGGSGTYMSLSTQGQNVMKFYGDWTIEWWMYYSVMPTGATFMSQRSGSTTTGWLIQTASATTMKIQNSATSYITFNTPPAGQWNHVAFTYQNGTLYAFVNGIMQGNFQAALTFSDGYLNINYDVFSGANSGLTTPWYMQNLRISKVCRYASNFTVPANTFPTIGEINADPDLNTVTYMPRAGNNMDLSGNNLSITANNMTASTFSKQDTYSWAFNGTNSSLVITAPGSATQFYGDWTYEGWYYFQSFTVSPVIVDFGYQGAGSTAVSGGLVITTGSGTGVIAAGSNGSALFTTGTVLSVGVWTHIAFVQQGTILQTYVNGVSVYSYTTTAAKFIVGTKCTVGAVSSGSNSYSEYLNGYVSGIRVSKIARYTSNFVPPTQPFPTALPTAYDPLWNDVSIMPRAYAGNIGLDLSGNNLPLTWYGTASTSNSVSKQDAYSFYFNGSSALQYDSSAAIAVAPNTAAQFSGDFTAECWINPSNLNGAYFMSTQNGSGTTAGINWAITASTGIINLQYSSSTAFLTTTGSVVAGVWSHIATVRQGSLITVYLNGLNVGSVSIANNFNEGKIAFGAQAQGGTAGTPFTGYMSGIRISKCARYTAYFTPPTQPFLSTGPSYQSVISTSTVDPFWNNVTCLMPLNGSLTDYSGNGLTFTGTTGLTFTSAPSLFGNQVGYYNGSATLMSASAPGNAAKFYGDFTVECWANFPTFAGTPIFLSTVSGNDANGFGFAVNTTGALYCAYNNSSSLIGPTSTTLVLNTWNHLALTRQGSTLSLWINGILQTSVSYSVALSDGNLVIGNYYATGNPMNGYLANIRITSGVCRYTANFVPPTNAFPTIADTTDPVLNKTIALFHLDNNTTDSSLNSKTYAVGGSGSSFSPFCKFGSNSFYPGTAGYISTSSPVLAPIGTGDMTWEAWVCMTGNSSGSAWSYGMILSDGDNSSPNGLGVNNGGTTPALIIAGGTVVVSSSAGGLSLNVWHHIAASRVNGYWSLYVDGMNVGNASSTSGPNSYIYVGNRANGNLGTSNLYIDEARVSAFARYTSNFVPSTYTVTAPSTYDPFWNEVVFLPRALSGNTGTNLSGNNLILSLNGTSTIVGSMQDSYMFSFNGSSNYLTVTNPGTIASFNGGDFTWEANWKFNSFTGNPVLYSNMGGSWNTSVFVVQANTSGTISVGSNGGNQLTTANAMVTGTKYHIAVVGNGGIMTIFVNGQSWGYWNYGQYGQLNNSGAMYMGSAGWVAQQYVNGYVDGIRITKAARYTATFTPPSTPFLTNGLSYAALSSSTVVDPFWNNVTYLLPLNNNITDYSGNNLSTTNTSVTFSTNPVKFGSYSAYFNGTTSNLSNTSPGSSVKFPGDFTIEAWIYPTAVGEAAGSFILGSVNSAGNLGFALYGGGLYPALVNYNVGWLNTTTTVACNLNAWNHVAATRQGNIIQIFVNGVVGATITNSTQFANSTLAIGYAPGQATSYFTGYMSNVRITNGVCRYSGNFTAPSQAFGYISDTTNDPVWNKTVFETGFEGTLTSPDISGNGITLTNNGSVTLSTANYKTGTQSAFFTGGNYLNNSTTSLWTGGDFTMEAWVYPTANGVTGSSIILAPSGYATSATNNIFMSIPAGTSNFAVGLGGGSSAGVISGSGNGLNAWSHVAIVKTGTTVLLFINGAYVNSTTTTFATGTGFAIGTLPAAGAANAFTGYIDQIRISSFARYTSNFVPPTLYTTALPTIYDPYWQDVTFMPRAQTGNLITDVSGNYLGITNTSVTTTISNAKQDAYAMVFNGSTSTLLISTPGSMYNLSGDFTIETWVYPTAVGQTNGSFIIGNLSGTTTGIWLAINPSTYTLVYGKQGSSPTLTASTSMTVNTWNHVALVRQGTTMTMYLNGTSVGTISDSTSYSSTAVYIGNVSAAGTYWNGSMSGMRITKAARYTANFANTLPTTPFLTVGPT